MQRLRLRREPGAGLVQHERRCDGERSAAAFHGGEDDADRRLVPPGVNEPEAQAPEPALEKGQAFGKGVGPVNERQNALRLQKVGAGIEPALQPIGRGQRMRFGAAQVRRAARAGSR